MTDVAPELTGLLSQLEEPGQGHWFRKPHPHPLPDALAVAVPLRIAEFRTQGGPTDTDWKLLDARTEDVAARSDVLLFGGKKGEAARLFVNLVEVIAILSFVPGGIRVLGMHWETKQPAS